MAQRASRSRIVAATALITLGIATLASMVLLSAQRVEAITPPVDPAPETPAYSVTMVDLPDTIDSPSLNVSGTATPLENITVQAIGGNDADVFCNTAADAEGNWGCTVAFSYNDGIEIQAYRTGLSTYYLEDFAHDFLGYVSPAGIDQTWGNLYWNGYFTYGVYGDKGVGSDVQILLDGESVECDFYDPWAGAQPTKWYCELSGAEVGWDLGSYTLTAVTSVTDGANTWQGASADATLIVERDSPSMAAFTFPKEVSPNPPPNLHALRLIDAVGTPYFEGTGEPGAFVTVGYIDAENVSESDDFSDWLMGESGTIIFCETQVWENGWWGCSQDIYSEMEPGHTYYVGTSQEDLATNRTLSPRPQFRYTFSDNAVTPTIIEPAAGSTIIGHNVTISGTAPAGEYIELYRYPAGGGEGAEIFDCGNWIDPVDGAWSCAIANLPYGTYTFYALGVEDCGECSASVSNVVELTFTLTAPVIPPNVPVPHTTSTPTPVPWVYDLTDPDGNAIDPSDLEAGESVVITADGLPPGAVVDVEIHSTPISLGSGTVDSLGTLRMPITIPETVEPGTHTLVATMTPPGGVASTVSVPVVVGAVAAADEPLSDTGAEPATEETVAPTETDSGSGEISDAGDGGADFSQPSTIGSTLQTWDSVKITTTTLAVVGAMTMALIVLVALPAELLQSTLSANYARAFGWLAPVTARGRRFRARIPAFLKDPKVSGFLTVATTALVLCFADPQFGANWWSLRLWLAVFLSLFMVNVVSMSIVRAVARRKYGVESRLDPMPATILIVAASVLVSRLAHIEPGFLFGVVVGVIFVRELMKIEEGRLASLGALVLIGLGIVSWVAYSLLPGPDGAGTAVQFMRDFTAATTLESLSTLLIALLPLAFLEGEGIFRWHKAVWAVVYAGAVTAFVIVVVPMGESWGDMTAPIFGWTTLFLIFAVIATGVWAYFKLRPTPEAAHEELESETAA